MKMKYSNRSEVYCMVKIAGKLYHYLQFYKDYAKQKSF